MMQFDADLCVGTFRWRSGKKFVDLPRWSAAASAAAAAPRKLGWDAWLRSRCPAGPDAAVAGATSDLSMIDGLSFPLTVMFGLRRLGLAPGDLRQAGYTTGLVLRIVVAGATASAEQRLVHDSGYWAELGLAYSEWTVELIFVGPECDPNFLARRAPRLASNMTSSALRSSVAALLQARPELCRWDPGSKSSPAAITVIMGYNPGFGSGSAALMRSWAPDLQQIAASGLPCIFSQANDYSDVRGELAVLRHVVGARWVSAPMRNPFHMATTTTSGPANATDGRGWSCGNSFLYAIQGFAGGQAGPKLNLADETVAGRVFAVLEKALVAAEAAGGKAGELSVELAESEYAEFRPPFRVT